MELDPDMLITLYREKFGVAKFWRGKLSLTACYSFTGCGFILIVTL